MVQTNKTIEYYVVAIQNKGDPMYPLHIVVVHVVTHIPVVPQQR